MSAEFSEFAPVARPVVIQPETLEEIPKPTPPTKEEIEATALLFAQQQKQEQETAAGLLNLWAGAMVLHDILDEHLSPPRDKESDIDEKEKDKLQKPDR